MTESNRYCCINLLDIFCTYWPGLIGHTLNSKRLYNYLTKVIIWGKFIFLNCNSERIPRSVLEHGRNHKKYRSLTSIWVTNYLAGIVISVKILGLKFLRYIAELTSLVWVVIWYEYLVKLSPLIFAYHCRYHQPCWFNNHIVVFNIEKL